MTSLSGFDALLRGKRVTTYGSPFYAGWGLTDDRASIARRHRRLLLDELVAGALVLYPRYWDPRSASFVELEKVLERILEVRSASAGRPAPCELGHPRQKIRKWIGFLHALLLSLG